MRHYRLEGRETRPADDFAAWALWYETANRRVAFTQARLASVSTVFLGTDQALLPDDPPILFETKVFGGPLDGEVRRYSTWDDAERGHGEIVSRALAAEQGPGARPTRKDEDFAGEG
jgi:hypothetical protein